MQMLSPANMFGADLAYMDNIMNEEYGRDSLLPEYLYPAFRIPNPWNRQTNQTHLDCDIIVIAEFSELEGPKPVITIPNDRDIHFNINDFTVRIMSVDQGSSGQQGFNMPEDTQVLMSDTKENIYAFVHNFVLLDKQARGYSRPFAISYVTSDQRKLLNFYEEISSNFKKIARFLKYGNKLVFKNDLDKVMMDLHYTKDQLVNRYRTTIQPGHTDQDNKLLQSLKILESKISEIQAVLGQLNPTLNDKRMEQRFSRIEERAQVNKGKVKYDSGSLCDWDSIETPENQIHFSSLGNTAEDDNFLFFDSQHYKPKLVEITKGRKFDLHLRGLHELCSWGAKEGLQKLRHIYQYFQQDVAVLQMEKKDLSLIDPQSGLVTFGNKVVAANFMTNIDKICISTCCFMRIPLGTNTMDSWNMLNRSWSSNDTLSSFKSLPSSFQSFVGDVDDNDDAESMLSATSDLGYYLQRTNSIGSFQLVGSHDSFRLSITPPTDGFVPDTEDSLHNDNSNFIDNLEKTATNENLDANCSEDVENTNTDDHAGVLDDTLKISQGPQSADINFGNQNVISENLTAGSDSDCSGSKLGISESFSVNVSRDDLEDSVERDRSGTIVFNRDHSKTIVNQDCTEVTQKSNYKNKDDNIDENTILNSEKNINETKIENTTKNLVYPSAIENLGNLISDGHILCQTCSSLDVSSSSGVSSCSGCQSQLSHNLQAEDDKLNTSNSRRGSTTEVDFSKTDIFKFSTQTDLLSAGFGIMKVLLSYSYIQNVIYSLLIGRTVVIIGSAKYEEDIKSLVMALKLFLPGCHRSTNSCVVWSCKSVSLSDIIDIKLIGVCRHEKKSVDRMVPKSVKKFVTLLDIEKRIIESPVYQGSLITTMLSRKKSFKTEEGYVNFIKASLYDFSTKAFIYFHSFCLGSVGTAISNKSTVIGESDSAKKTATSFLNKLGIQDCDVYVIEYLTEVVKYQHIEDHYKSVNPTGAPPRPVTRTVHSCHIFKC